LPGADYHEGVDYIVAVTPSVGVGVLFFIIMRIIFTADRREREAARKWEREQEHHASHAAATNSDNVREAN